MNVRVLAAVGAALVLAACGSDKKSTPAGRSVAYTGPTTAASFDAQTNTTQIVAGAAVMAQEFGGNMSGALAFGAGVAPRGMTIQNALLLAAEALQDPAGAAAAGAVTSNTRPCASNVGSMTMTTSRASPAATTAGDYVEISFSGCADGAGLLSDGSFRVTFDTAASSVFVADPVQITADRTFGITLAFSNMVTYDASTTAWDGTNGSISLSFAASVANGTLTYTISSPLLEGGSGVGGSTSSGFRMSAFSDVAVAVYNHLGAGATLTGGRWDFDGRICATEMGGCANIVTNPVFVQTEPNLYPDSGSIRISDDVGDYVQVTATGGGNAQVGWSINGSTGTSNTTWAALQTEAAQ